MFKLNRKKSKLANRYHMHPEAMIISCFFNPQNSPYRLKAFELFYESIKHLNHTIIECVIGDSTPQLKENENIKRIYTENLLWHKESLLNKIISDLPLKYKYLFWLDADVIFTNLDWIVEGVHELQSNNIIQPFEYCVFLEKDEIKPSFSMNEIKDSYLPNAINNKVWRSFSANFVDTELWKNGSYHKHGHVGFAWGAKREILDTVPLFDKALLGGGDHIIAHAAAGQIPHSCITNDFSAIIDLVNQWSADFYQVVKGKIGFVKGDIYHLWHGDIEKRQYVKRHEYTSKTKEIILRDENGLFITNEIDDTNIKQYFEEKEVIKGKKNNILQGFFLTKK
jgi:hypothetical protein